ncbi:MAG: hypothetical protein ACRDSL_21240 [Pseudonocardiaceae bacterium]
MTGDPALPAELRAEIISSFERRLQALRSPILDSPDTRTQLLDQARSILDEVVDSYREITESINLNALSLSIEIGTSRAIEGVHPAESLRAAAVLFETRSVRGASLLGGGSAGCRIQRRAGAAPSDHEQERRERRVLR